MTGKEFCAAVEAVEFINSQLYYLMWLMELEQNKKENARGR